MSITDYIEDSGFLEETRYTFPAITLTEDENPAIVKAGVRERCFVLTQWLPEDSVHPEHEDELKAKWNSRRNEILWINIGAWEQAPTTGKWHCHTAVKFANAVSSEGIRKMFPGDWVQTKAKNSTWDQVEAYCNKNGAPLFWYGPVFDYPEELCMKYWYKTYNY